jgi:uncharacterized membrane protein
VSLVSAGRAFAARLRGAGPPQVLAVTAITLALAGFSVVHTFQVLALKDRPDFLLLNTLGSPHGRTLFIITLLAGAVLPLLAALGYLAWRDRPERVHQAAAMVAPLCLAFMLPPLFTWRYGHDHTLVYLVTLGLFGLGLRRLLPGSLTAIRERFAFDWSRLRPAVWACTLAVALGALGYAVYMSYFTINNHHLIGTTAFDLGIYDNLLYNARHGRLFHSPVLFGPGNRSYIAGHAEFAMLLFVPFYAIKPGAETMLVMQATLLGAAALPLYLFARRLIPAAAAALLALGYLMFAPLHGPNFYDFHWLPLNIFFVFWLFYGLVTRRAWVTVLSTLVIFAIREDTAVGTALLGLFLLVTGWRPREGLLLAVASSVWFVIVRFMIMPLAGSWFFPNLYGLLFADGAASFESVIRTLLTNPIYVLWSLLKEEKLIYVLHMLTALALVPVRRLGLVLLLIPGVFFTILTTDSPPMVSIAFQYTTHWIPYLFCAAVLSLAGLWEAYELRPRFYAAVVAMVIALASHSYNFGAVLQHHAFVGGFRTISFEMTPYDKQRYAGLRQLIDQIPREASVGATEYMNPHVSARLDSFVLRQDPGDVDYILLSNREAGESVRNILNTLFKRTSYGLVGNTSSEFYLFKKGLQAPGTRAAYQQLGLVVP